MAPFAFSESGRVGLNVDYWLPLEKCIALAWLTKEPGSSMRVNLIDGFGPSIHLENIEWEEGEEADECEPLPGEKWKKLKWKVGCVRVNEGYLISNQGRLRNENGHVTSGFWFNETRLASTNAGLVDLWAAARIKRGAVHLREAVKEAADCILSGHTAQDLSESRDIQLDSAWSLINKAAMSMHVSDLGQLAPCLVAADMWDLMVDMSERGHPLLGGRLTPLKEYLDDRLGEEGEYASTECPWAEIRFARTCIAARS